MDTPTSESQLPESSAPQGSYSVLARRYRPRRFQDLRGQEVVLRTLSHAFATGRLAHAWIFTGMRGVGKTTAARLLARALNYVPKEGVVQTFSPSPPDQACLSQEEKDFCHAPIFDPPEEGLHCAQILEGQHIDVIEMDAASHTSVNEVRAITDSIQYKPVLAPYKIYILDEVHMLSTAAFNALLKTLEEPPPHVKFIFATTELRKIPVTFLSRCQRFDLKRLSDSALLELLECVLQAESIPLNDPSALSVLIKASEGSARDALSLLDQAISFCGNALTEEGVRTMLGLVESEACLSLFSALVSGQAAEVLKIFAEHSRLGIDPLTLLSTLAELVHNFTRLKLLKETEKPLFESPTLQKRAVSLAEEVSVRVLMRAWQILLKGIEELRIAPRPAAAAEMVLVRLCYMADLPEPEEVLRQLKKRVDGTSRTPSPAPSLTPSLSSLLPTPSPSPALSSAFSEMPLGKATASFETAEDLIAFVRDVQRDLLLKEVLCKQIHFISFRQGFSEFVLGPETPPLFAQNLSQKLQEWTGQKWQIVAHQWAVYSRTPPPTLHAQQQAREEAEREILLAEPSVQAVLSAFPGAKMTGFDSLPQ